LASEKVEKSHREDVMRLKTWEDAVKLIEHYNLAFEVIQFNMSLRGVLVGKITGDPVANTFNDAVPFLRAAESWAKGKSTQNKGDNNG
jgi:hypothetical protein